MNDTKVCVVSLIGKTQLLHYQSKAWKLNALIQKNFFKTTSFEPTTSRLLSGEDDLEHKDYKKEFGIETYHDIKNRVIYIHLESIYDTNNALDLLFENSKLDAPKTFFELWEQEHIKYLKAILFLFSISHIIIISSPSCEFEIGYIRFFRIVETLRVKLLPSIVDLIKSLNLPITKEWLYAGRPCSPRVLFTFENCPSDLLSTDLNDSKQAKLIEKLQHSLEDQIYNSLRKSYVITNISNNSLFSIPANQEFAYIHRVTAHNSLNTNRFLLSNLFMQCSKSPKDLTNSFSMRSTTPSFNQNLDLNYLSNQIINNESLDLSLFRKFVFEHIKTALKDGFNDNIGRTNVTPVFDLPSVSCFDKLFDALGEFFLGEPKSVKLKRQYAEIKAHVDTESQFSENRCKKVLPAALNIYQENLPGHYTKIQHQQRLDKAIHFYSLQARGPMYDTFLEQLTNECLKIWTNGRQLCEAISLTEHPCVYNLHKVPNSSSDELDPLETESAKETEFPDKTRSRSAKNNRRIRKTYRHRSQQDSDNHTNETSDSEDSIHSRDDSMPSRISKNPPCKRHNSNIVTIAASNCGEFQSERKDPFDLKEANYSYYEEFSKMATKKKLIKYELQTFKPNNNETCVSQFEKNHEKPITQLQETQPFSYSNLGQEEDNNKGDNKRDHFFPSPVSEQSILHQQKSSSEKVSISPIRTTNLTTLNSNEIYLLGMTHSESPAGLLPRFSSWSLVSIGKYSHYNAHSGINQPGLLSNHNHLLPWDIIVSRHLVISSVDKQLMASRKNAKKQGSNTDSVLSNQLASLSLGNNSVTVRAYIGMEYECPCGHRFFCSGPDKLSKLSSNGNVKDDAYKLLFENMPLYTACPCRKETPYMAQMMRVFIVTPVSYTINLADLDSKKNVSPPPPRRNKSPADLKNAVRISIQINPRVQPGPSSPIYFPSDTLPINLSENNIWVLRLPYIYMGDSGQPYYRPKDFETLKSCRILKGMFQAVLVNNEHDMNRNN